MAVPEASEVTDVRVFQVLSLLGVICGLTACTERSECEGSAAAPVLLTPGTAHDGAVCASRTSYYRVEAPFHTVFMDIQVDDSGLLTPLGGADPDPVVRPCLDIQIYSDPAEADRTTNANAIGFSSSACQTSGGHWVGWYKLPAPPYYLVVFNETGMGMSYTLRVE